jgi:hypothetical protein
MPSITDHLMGSSPDLILSETSDELVLRSKYSSKFLISLMLVLLHLLLLPLFMPIEHVFKLLLIPILGGLTYSKTITFDLRTATFAEIKQLFGIKLKKEIKFDEIDGVVPVTYPLRRGTYVFLNLKNQKRRLIVLTTDQAYVRTVVGAFNRVLNLT